MAFFTSAHFFPYFPKEKISIWQAPLRLRSNHTLPVSLSFLFSNRYAAPYSSNTFFLPFRRAGGDLLRAPCPVSFLCRVLDWAMKPPFSFLSGGCFFLLSVMKPRVNFSFPLRCLCAIQDGLDFVSVSRRTDDSRRARSPRHGPSLPLCTMVTLSLCGNSSEGAPLPGRILPLR